MNYSQRKLFIGMSLTFCSVLSVNVFAGKPVAASVSMSSIEPQPSLNRKTIREPLHKPITEGFSKALVSPTPDDSIEPWIDPIPHLIPPQVFPFPQPGPSQPSPWHRFCLPEAQAQPRLDEPKTPDLEDLLESIPQSNLDDSTRPDIDTLLESIPQSNQTNSIFLSLEELLESISQHSLDNPTVIMHEFKESSSLAVSNHQVEPLLSFRNFSPPQICHSIPEPEPLLNPSFPFVDHPLF